MAKASTPLDAVLSGIHAPSHGVLLLTAGGGNPDVLGAVEHLAKQEPAVFAALCLRKRSALADLATETGWLSVVDYDLPSGKDGFLATNSLLASVVLLARAYSEGCGDSTLPDTLAEVFGTTDLDSFVASLSADAAPLWKCRTIVVLYSASTYPAALDFESKFSEAAIGNVQIADYRNFAHGRHHWIAREGDDTAVLAFATTELQRIADFTLGALPEKVVRLRLNVGAEGPRAAISALSHVLYLVGLAGVARGINPGKPHVPQFGRKIYHLNAFSRLSRSRSSSPREDVAIQRKTLKSVRLLEITGELAKWREHYREFMSRLAAAAFCAVVLDYDGTLCVPSERFGHPNSELMECVARLTRGGVSVGVVTGRGRSVRMALQESLPRASWRRVLIGYYNGAVVAPLGDNDQPAAIGEIDPVLATLCQALQGDMELSRAADIECRQFQVSLQAKEEPLRSFLWERIQRHLSRSPGARAVESAHSVDVLAPGVSKLNLIPKFCESGSGGDSGDVLCIGDCGRWPGNDFDLLTHPYSLSVGTVSSSPDSCWNIASPGNRLIAATREYLTELFAPQKRKLVLMRPAGGESG